MIHRFLRGLLRPAFLAAKLGSRLLLRAWADFSERDGLVGVLVVAQQG